MAILTRPGALSWATVVKFLRALRAASACLLKARSEFIVVVFEGEAMANFPKSVFNRHEVTLYSPRGWRRRRWKVVEQQGIELGDKKNFLSAMSLE